MNTDWPGLCRGGTECTSACALRPALPIRERCSCLQVQNDSKPLWTRSAKEVSREEQNAFFKTTFK